MSKKNIKKNDFDFDIDIELLSKPFPPYDRFEYDEEAKKHEEELAAKGGFVVY